MTGGRAEVEVLASAATSASYNMVVQLAFRILTFVLNAFTLRYVSKELLGVVNVRLLLLYSTVAFVAREAFRRACLSKSSRENWQQVINLLWCTVPVSLVWSALFGYVWLYVIASPDPHQVPYYAVGVVSYAAAIVIEMTTEPLFVTAQSFLFVRVKVLTESLSILFNCLTVVILVILVPRWGVIVFSVAKLVYSFVYVSCYYGYFTWYVRSSEIKKNEDFPLKCFRDFFPRIRKDKSFIPWELGMLTWSFFKQSFLKQILTEGERYVMTLFNILSFGDQGVYDVVNNLGSLAARFIFLPIEESSYLFFSQMFERNKPLEKQEQSSANLATNVLRNLLRLVTLIGLTFLVFGYSYSDLLLEIYGGKLLSSGTGPVLLRWYCVYVLIIAVNGTTECFMFATMSKDQVDRYNHKMLVFSVVFLVSSWQLTVYFGSVGFIWANCFNMLARISYSVYFIRHYYGRHPQNPLVGLVPSIPVICAYILAGIATTTSQGYFCCSGGIGWIIIHIGIGGIGLLCVLLVIYISEKEFITFVVDHYKQSTRK